MCHDMEFNIAISAQLRKIVHPACTLLASHENLMLLVTRTQLAHCLFAIADNLIKFFKCVLCWNST